MKYVDFKKFTDENGACPIYLFEGEEVYFREKGEELIKSRFVQEPTLDFASFDGATLKGEKFRAVVDAVKRLEDKYSNALYLYYVTERPIREIAALLGVPEKTVYTRIERGKKKLLEMLGKEGIT